MGTLLISYSASCALHDLHCNHHNSMLNESLPRCKQGVPHGFSVFFHFEIFLVVHVSYGQLEELSVASCGVCDAREMVACAQLFQV